MPPDSRFALLLCLLCGLGSACAKKAERSTVARAQFGIFYGGQVQERRELPLELDRNKQRQGFHLEFRPALPRATEVSWQLDMPSPTRKAGAGMRVTQLGRALVREGSTSFDQTLEFRSSDVPGTWNIRVLVGDELAIDRPFLVYDPIARERARKSDAGPLR
jgi:hypothetical protein